MQKIILDICFWVFMSELNGGLLTVPTSITVFPLVDVTKTLGSLSFGHFLFLLCKEKYSEGLCLQRGFVCDCIVLCNGACPLLVVGSSAWLSLFFVDVVVSLIFNCLCVIYCGCIPG